MCIQLQQQFKGGVSMKEIVNELGSVMLSGVISVAALGLMYGSYSGYFKQMVEIFFISLCG